jgi:hypothetical protein
MEKMEYFDSKNEMNEYFDNAKERAGKMKESFKEKYANNVNCEALFEDIKNMYLKEKSTESILSLGDREEYRNIDKTDLGDLIGVFAFEYGQIPRERERYTFKKDSDPGSERDIEPDRK